MARVSRHSVTIPRRQRQSRHRLRRAAAVVQLSVRLYNDKAVTDSILRHLGSYFKRQKRSSVRPLACITGITVHSL